MARAKKISILGSTGSIGRQTLNVLENLEDIFQLETLTANRNITLLEEQALKYKPRRIVIADEKEYRNFKKNTKYKGDIFFGKGAIKSAAEEDIDIIVSALVGFSGVEPTLAAINKGITVALANKESLVSAGEIITSAAKKSNSEIIAVDSEHNAILQCMTGESKSDVEKLILTASGGPFFRLSKEEFKNITIKQALNHPKWSMGNKITIDSATMMNKGLEVIEARWLFDIPVNKIDVVVHPQSIIHSMAQFVDGSVKAQMGIPDMRIPISYALTKPKRHKFDFPRLDLAEISKLEFFKPDFEKFACLQLAYKAMESGGAYPAIMNAANEVAVDAFLKGKISFIQIADCIDEALGAIIPEDKPQIEDIIFLDFKTREFTNNFINSVIA